VLLIQFLGVPFALFFGWLGSRIGAKRSIFLGLAVYLGVCGFGFFLRTPTHFYVLAVMVAMVQGGVQALSRSLFASMIPRHKSSEFFGFFAIFEKFAGLMGPLVFGVVGLVTGDSRWAIVAIGAFFLVGAALLARVDVEAGRAAARVAEPDGNGPQSSVVSSPPEGSG
jgi:UMF1 family MFS transporter